jgi:hypothetical protein
MKAVVMAIRERELTLWEIGDALVEECKDRQELKRLAAELEGYTRKQLVELRSTAESFPQDRRRADVGWHIHAAAGSPWMLDAIIAAAPDGQKLDRSYVTLLRKLIAEHAGDASSLRKQAAGFLDLCFDPKRAAEITLQPIRRFGFDAAILFSDILAVPHALGQRVNFVEGEGPRLDALKDPDAFVALRAEVDHAVLAPVYEIGASARRIIGTFAHQRCLMPNS